MLALPTRCEIHGQDVLVDVTKVYVSNSMSTRIICFLAIAGAVEILPPLL